MRFELTIDMDNDAFDNPAELPRILRELAKRIKEVPEIGTYSVQDVNGNTVGRGHYVGRKNG